MNPRFLCAALWLLVGCRPPAPPPAPLPAPPAAGATAQLSPAAELEVAYLSTSDLYRKIEIMSDLADVAPSEAVEVIGRLFVVEEDAELQEELLYSLLDVAGETDAKLRVLEAALHPDLPAGVRLMAVDLLVELGDARALTVLQPHLADPNPEVRQAVEDALQDLL